VGDDPLPVALAAKVAALKAKNAKLIAILSEVNTEVRVLEARK